MFIGRTDAEAETPILWPPMLRAGSLEKTLMLGKIEEGSSPWESQMGSLTSFLNFFWPSCLVCGILVPQPGIEPGPSAVKVQSPNNWSASEFLILDFLNDFF